MDLGLTEKVVIVTGGSRGIGLHISRQMAREGALVVVVSRDETRLRHAVDLISRDSPRSVSFSADVTEPGAAERIIEFAVAKFGGVDVLVNNVGGAVPGRLLLDSTDDDWRLGLDLNLLQAVRLTRAAVPAMDGRQGANIVNIASISGWRQKPASTGQYGAAKSGLIFLAERWALELGSRRIRVNTVSPGAIETDGWTEIAERSPERYRAFLSRSLPHGRIGTGQEVADVVTFIASERASWINGRNIPVDGGEQYYPTAPWST